MTYSTRSVHRGPATQPPPDYVDNTMSSFVMLLCLLVVILLGIITLTTKSQDVPVCDAEDYPTVVPCVLPGGTYMVLEMPPHD